MAKSRWIPIRTFGPLERRVMEVVWELGDATVRSVAERLDGDRGPAYTTVMTVMARLAEKGVLERRLEGRTYVYRATATKAEFLASTARAMANRLREDFGDLAVARFVEGLTEVPDPRFRDLAALAKEEREAMDEP